MSQTSPSLSQSATSAKPTNFRWVICGLLFYATTVNYVDRSVLGVLAGDLQKIIGWADWQYGLINAAFTLAYAVGFILMGRLIDTIGTRAGYAIALTIWTFAGAATALAGSPFQFGLCRFSLGVGEAGNFPAAVKTVAEWFPQKQRATATGIFNAGSNVGAILAPLLVPIVVFAWGNHVLSSSGAPAPATPAASVTAPSATGAPSSTAPAAPTVDPKIRAGWPAAFLITPILAAIWVALWLGFYRPPERSRFANAAERSLIHEVPVGSEPAPTRGFPVGDMRVSDGPMPAALPPASAPAPVRWRNLLPHRQAWAFMMGKFLTDPIWWFYLFWSGKFFSERFGVGLKGLAGPLILVYVVADVGSVLGGYFSSALINRGWSVNAARKTAFITCACLILPVILAPIIPTDWITASGFNYGMWIAASLIGIAAAAHQGFSATIFTTTSDMFPKRAISSVVGLGGLAGALSGMVMQAVAGVIKEVTKSYVVMFIIAGTVYLLAVVVIQLLAPRLARVDDADLETKPMPLPVTGVLSAVGGFIAGVFVSYFIQSHSGPAATLPIYVSSIVTGDIFKTGGSYVTTLAITPLCVAALAAIIGIALHAGLGRPRRPG